MKYELAPVDSETLAVLDAETDAILAAIRESVREAVIRHKRLGLPMVSWESGRVVWISANQLPEYEEPLSQFSPGPLPPKTFCSNCQAKSLQSCSCIPTCRCQDRV